MQNMRQHITITHGACQSITVDKEAGRKNLGRGASSDITMLPPHDTILRTSTSISVWHPRVYIAQQESAQPRYVSTIRSPQDKIFGYAEAVVAITDVNLLDRPQFAPHVDDEQNSSPFLPSGLRQQQAITASVNRSINTFSPAAQPPMRPTGTHPLSQKHWFWCFLGATGKDRASLLYSRIATAAGITRNVPRRRCCAAYDRTELAVVLHQVLDAAPDSVSIIFIQRRSALRPENLPCLGV